MYDQIDNLIKTTIPRRSKSIGRAAAEKLTTSSHHSETSLNSGSGHSRSRGSIGDGKAIPGFPVDQRSGSRTSVDNPPSSHKRAESAASGCSESLNNSSMELEVRFFRLTTQITEALISIHQERMLNDEFDELMRSGTTMKVSLTPDRLKTMEVRSPFSDPGSLLTLAFRCSKKRKAAASPARAQTNAGLMSFHARKIGPSATARHYRGRSMSLRRTMKRLLLPFSFRTMEEFTRLIPHTSERELPSLTQTAGPALYQPLRFKWEPPTFSPVKLPRSLPNCLSRSLKSVSFTVQALWKSPTDPTALATSMKLTRTTS